MKRKRSGKRRSLGGSSTTTPIKGIAKEKKKSRQIKQAKSAQLNSEVLRCIATKLRHSSSYLIFRSLNATCAEIVDSDIRNWSNNTERNYLNVDSFINDKNPLTLKFYNTESPQDAEDFHADVRRALEKLKQFVKLWATRKNLPYLVNLNVKSLGWMYEHDDCEIRRCPAELQKKVKKFMRKCCVEMKAAEYSKSLLRPTRFFASLTVGAASLTKLDLGEISPNIVQKKFLKTLENLRELVWYNADLARLVQNLPFPHLLKSLWISSDFPISRLVFFFHGLENLYTKTNATIMNAKAYLRELIFARYERIWSTKIYVEEEYQSTEEKINFAVLNAQTLPYLPEDIEKSDYGLLAFHNIKSLAFWEAPTKIFEILASCFVRLESLQFGHLSQNLSHLASVDRVMSAIDYILQSRSRQTVTVGQVSVRNLKMFLCANIMSLESFVPTLLCNLNSVNTQRIFLLDSLELFVRCSICEDASGTWKKDRCNAEQIRKDIVFNSINLKEFKFHTDGYCMLESLCIYIPPSIESLTISLVIPPRHAKVLMESVIEFINRLSDVNLFPELEELHLQVWGIRCAERLLHSVTDNLHDLKKLSIIAMPVNEDRDSLIELLKHVGKTCGKLNTLGLSAPLVNLLAEKYGDLYKKNWRKCLQQLEVECGYGRQLEIVIKSLPEGDEHNQLWIKPIYPDVGEKVPESEDEDEDDNETRRKQRAKRFEAEEDDSYGEDEDDSFLNDDIVDDEESDDEIDELDLKLEKETSKREKKWQKKRAVLGSASSSEDEMDQEVEPREEELAESGSSGEEEEKRVSNPFFDDEAEEDDTEEDEGTDGEEDFDEVYGEEAIVEEDDVMIADVNAELAEIQYSKPKRRKIVLSDSSDNE